MGTGSAQRRCRGLLVALLACLALTATPALAVAAEDPAAAMYSPGTIDAIDLSLSPAAITALEAEPDEYVEGTFSLAPTNGTPAGVEAPLTPTPLTVGVRLKGNVGSSFRDLTEKAAFKIKFNEFVSGQKFLGLKKMTLNNMVEDPSMIHETLTYAAFRSSGVPAPRTGYAYVRVNGDDYGVYLNIETLDDVALKKMFGDFDDETQHLYEGEDGADVKPGGAADFEVDEGDEGDLADLEALIAAVGSTGSSAWADRVAPFADLGEMTRMWALDKYVGRWDGYAGEKRGVNQPNNYYLFSDPLGRFQMLPWGSDETWEERLPFDGAAGLMFDRCLADGSCSASYWESLRTVRAAVGGAGLDPLAVAIAKLLQPWQAIDPRKEESAGQIAAAVAATRDFLAARPGEADGWLSAHVPPAPAVAATRTGAPAPASSPPGPAEPVLRFGHIGRHGGALTLRLWLSLPGLVTQRALLTTRKGSLLACSDRVRATAAGPITLRCRLSNAVRERLRRHRLRLTFTTRVQPQGAAPETIVRRVSVPRLRPR